ncbi:MAG: transketolase C-terminal domain-containing protein, partial [bacterium]
LADALAKSTGVSVGVVNARFAKPIDVNLLREQSAAAKLFVTMEDAVVTGGFGTAVLEALSEAGSAAKVVRLGWPDAFVGHASDVKTLREQNGLGAGQMVGKVGGEWAR